MPAVTERLKLRRVMARRHNHYEAAFEDYVRSRGWPYLPVDEQKKAIFAGARVKSFDFLVYRSGRGNGWLVDVKGRKFPYEVNGQKRYWENWVTREDLDGLTQWQEAFGEQFEAGLVFAYWLTGEASREPAGDIHTFRGTYYAFLWMRVSDYITHARQRSPKWDTVSVPVKTFQRLAAPVGAELTSQVIAPGGNAISL